MMTTARTTLLASFLVALAAAAACGPTNPPLVPTPDVDAAVPTTTTTTTATQTLADDSGAAQVPAVDAAAPTSNAVDAAAGAPSDAGAALYVPTCSTKTASFSKDVLPIMSKSCGGIEGCHGFTFRSAATAMKFLGGTGDGCTDNRKIVAAGDLAHSYLVDKLTNANLCKGRPMPKTINPAMWKELPQDQVQTIADWICAGGKND
jgi:hypothetical protein